MSEGLLNLLNQHSSVPAEDFSKLMQLAEVRHYAKKEIITNIGDTEQYLYFILKGIVRKFFYKGKHEVITHIFPEGSITGSAASFLDGNPSKYVIDTIEPTSALALSKQRLESLYQNDKKWEKIGRMVTSHFLLVQEYRMLDNIRYSTRERFIRFMNENPELLQRVPQKYLASYLNIKPETFSRLKHLMVKKIAHHPK
jgi:signal-transduction protein with cAMP-binding, CBS, and nucleotidyltransferase domain